MSKVSTKYYNPQFMGALLDAINVTKLIPDSEKGKFVEVFFNNMEDIIAIYKSSFSTRAIAFPKIYDEYFKKTKILNKNEFVNLLNFATKYKSFFTFDDFATQNKKEFEKVIDKNSRNLDLEPVLQQVLLERFEQFTSKSEGIKVESQLTSANQTIVNSVKTQELDAGVDAKTQPSSSSAASVDFLDAQVEVPADNLESILNDVSSMSLQPVPAAPVTQEAPVETPVIIPVQVEVPVADQPAPIKNLMVEDLDVQVEAPADNLESVLNEISSISLQPAPVSPVAQEAPVETQVIIPVQVEVPAANQPAPADNLESVLNEISSVSLQPAPAASVAQEALTPPATTINNGDNTTADKTDEQPKKASFGKRLLGALVGNDASLAFDKYTHKKHLARLSAILTAFASIAIPMVAFAAPAAIAGILGVTAVAITSALPIIIGVCAVIGVLSAFTVSTVIAENVRKPSAEITDDMVKTEYMTITDEAELSDEKLTTIKAQMKHFSASKYDTPNDALKACIKQYVARQEASVGQAA